MPAEMTVSALEATSRGIARMTNDASTDRTRPSGRVRRSRAMIETRPSRANTAVAAAMATMTTISVGVRGWGRPVQAVMREPSRTSHETAQTIRRSEEHTFELQSRGHLVCRLLLETKNDYRLVRIIII